MAENTDWRWDPGVQLAPQKLAYGLDFRSLSVFSDVSEIALFPPPETQYSPDRPPSGEFFVTPPPPPFELFFHNTNAPPKLPSIVLFGSSFLDWIVTLGAYSSFKDVYRMRGKSDVIGVALQAIRAGTRYFVYQFWEPDSGLLRQARIPQE